MRRNPTECERTLNLSQVYIHRHPLCRYESKCLSKAVRNGWKCFSCLKCPFFKKYKKAKQRKDEIYMVYLQEVWNKTYIC